MNWGLRVLISKAKNLEVAVGSVGVIVGIVVGSIVVVMTCRGVVVPRTTEISKPRCDPCFSLQNTKKM